MNNKNIGFSLIIFSTIFLFLFTSYTFEIKRSADIICREICGPEMQESCPHAQGIPLQSFFGYSLSFALASFGIYLFFSPRFEKTKPKTDLKKILRKLNKDERRIYKLIEENDGAIFQSELIKKTGFSKAKVSRILDKLEINGLVERRRRGMANLIILK